MTSVTPNPPSFPIGPSTAGEPAHDRHDRGVATLSFERLLGHASLAQAIPLNASFAETGTLGFEDGPPRLLADELKSLRRPAPVLPFVHEAMPLTTRPDALALAVPDRISASGGDIALASSQEHMRPVPETRSQLATSRAQLFPGAARLATPSTTVRTESPISEIQHTATSASALLEDALSSRGAAVSVAMELIDGVLRVHVHLPACPEVERQRLIARAREILEECGFAGAEVIAHAYSFDRGMQTSEGGIVRGS